MAHTAGASSHHCCTPPCACALGHALLAQVDFSSIPQLHKASQLAAINSLALYASIANALVVAVPQAKHVSTGLVAGADSYQRRAWCRAEQFCYSIGHGSKNFWIASSPDPADIQLADAKWLETCLLVFKGERGLLTRCAKMKPGLKKAASALAHQNSAALSLAIVRLL